MMMVKIVIAVFGTAFLAWALVHQGKKQDEYYEKEDTEDDQLFI